MDMNHVFRTGKYAGRTIQYVYSNDRRYFNWVVENRPEMLRSHKSKTQSIQNRPYKKTVYIDPPEENDEDERTMRPLSPNLDFDSQAN